MTAGPVPRATLALVRRGPDEGPLAIAGVYARGAAAEALIDALLGLDDAILATLRGVRRIRDDEALVVVTGPAEALPWRDGVRYLGVLAPGLLVPTTRTTSLPAALAADALARHLPAAWLEGTRASSADVLMPLRAGLPLSREAIVRGMSAGEDGGGS